MRAAAQPRARRSGFVLWSSKLGAQDFSGRALGKRVPEFDARGNLEIRDPLAAMRQDFLGAAFLRRYYDRANEIVLLRAPDSEDRDVQDLGVLLDRRLHLVWVHLEPAPVDHELLATRYCDVSARI